MGIIFKSKEERTREEEEIIKKLFLASMMKNVKEEGQNSLQDDETQVMDNEKMKADGMESDIANGEACGSCDGMGAAEWFSWIRSSGRNEGGYFYKK